MNLANGLMRMLWRFPGTGEASRRGKSPSARPPRKNARATLAWFAGAALLMNVAAFLLLEMDGSHYRDLEYGKRAVSLRERLAEYPDRPLVLVIGSSRASMGVRPAAWEEVRPNAPGHPDPLLFNMSL
ncbi:MAG TPA: hypothetical protein VGI99_08580, partial [Gemmataceae bacterium]